MDIQFNNNVFEQVTPGRDYTRQPAGLPARVAPSPKQSVGLGWPRHYQAENGERTEDVLLALLSNPLAVESAGTFVGNSLVFQCSKWPPASKYRADQKNPSPALGTTTERTEIMYRVILTLMEREQIPLARKALDALPVEQLGDPTIVRLRKILSAPVTKASGKRDIDRTLDYQWIRDHARDYRGQWVALDNGKLLEAAPSLHELLDRIKLLRSERRPLLHQIS
ncbi:MAG TPA: hypothetical protein VEG60_00270 [Candidatus Binatia bacterium]|nr:hypothetical protein [Candidatus Binatia bacterium]